MKCDSKYAQYQFTLFCRDAIFVANLRTFLAYNLQAKKCGRVQKMTNMVWIVVVAIYCVCFASGDVFGVFPFVMNSKEFYYQQENQGNWAVGSRFKVQGQDQHSVQR